jgi:hypothetical protein
MVAIKYQVNITNSTIAVGGTSQVAAIANPLRNYIEIQNTSDTDMWINFSNAAGTNVGFKLVAGAAYTTPANTTDTRTLNVFCTVTGKTYAIAES